jgi:predicted nucleotidyltransferase
MIRRIFAAGNPPLDFAEPPDILASAWKHGRKNGCSNQMDKNAVLEIVGRLRQGVEARGIRPRKVILYGSYADGTQREGSDIDLVVISDDLAGKGYWERIDILADAIYEVFAPIEAVAMTTEEWEQSDSILATFARKGEVVYAG